MRSIFVAILFTGFFFSSAAQDSIPPQLTDSAIATYISPDSQIKAENMEQMNRNLNRFVQEMKERDKKAKRNAFIRIGIGIFFLVILVIGLVRKKKKKKE